MLTHSNLDRLILARIPDIAAVYGGARGRTMSSKHQRYAWPALVEAGVKTVIDLRAADKSDRLPELCAEYGMRYFHYPVDNDRETIDSMVEKFPEFCQLIDEGDFYIACAMGLHRTDIALCLYWVFHGVDRGVAPPPLRGYRKDKGMTTDKIMRILNAVYKRMTELNDEPPMPEDVFKERKEMIKAAWEGKMVLD